MLLILLTAILLGSFGLLTLIDRLLGGGRIEVGLRGRIALAVLFLFTGLGHFLVTEPMAGMLPSWVPGRKAIVLVTGVLELAGAAGLLIPGFARLAGGALIVFLVLVFPANVFAALNRIDLGGHGAGPMYLLVRIPFQLLLIGWTYWFAARCEQ
jgi:uncharacterized membrane protein